MDNILNDIIPNKGASSIISTSVDIATASNDGSQTSKLPEPALITLSLASAGALSNGSIHLGLL